MSQHQLAAWAGTQQSSVSEYESRRKSPTLEVVERLLEAADAELAIKPIIDFDLRHDPEIGQYVVPERLWSVPMPDCFSKVHVLGILFKSHNPASGICRSRRNASTTTNGSSFVEHQSSCSTPSTASWERLNLPDVFREAWHPVIHAATAPQDTPPRDPAGFSAWLAGELSVSVRWPPPRARKRRR